MMRKPTNLAKPLVDLDDESHTIQGWLHTVDNRNEHTVHLTHDFEKVRKTIFDFSHIIQYLT